MNSIFCCLCKKMSKEHAEFEKILKKGDEKMEKYINAEFIYETLAEHQRILKQLKPNEVNEKVYDDIIDLSSDITAKTKPYLTVPQ